ncbi:MFS transporter [Glaciibacter sp. 2TAF33]|uniref:MFS transporter n=1 Tax=Glaciibacter sp. 2TAF33 TaxID=3233015 RepID=UPI003F8E355D
MSTVTAPVGTKIRLDKAQRGAFLGAFIGWVFDYYEVFLMTMLVIPIAIEFHLSTVQVGFLFSIQLLFLAIGGVFFGYLADKIGRKKVLMVTILIFSLGTLARGLAPNYEVLLVLTALAATGIGGEYGVGQTLVSETAPAKRRGWYSGLLYGGIYVGILAGALVGGYVAPAIGWRWTFVLSGLPVLFALWVRRSTPESEIWLNRDKNAKATRARVKITGHIVRVWLLCFLAAALQFFAYYGLASFLPTYLVKNGSSVAGASTWLIFTAVAGAIGCYGGALLSDRIGRRATLSILAGTACIGGLILAISWAHLLEGTWILIPFFILFAGSNGAAVFGALFTELFPSEIRATAVSSALQVGRGMSFFPPLIAAALLPVFGYQPIIFLSAGLFGVLALVAWAFKETRGSSLGASGSPASIIDSESVGAR